LAFAALALVLFGAYDSYPMKPRSSLKEVLPFPCGILECSERVVFPGKLPVLEVELSRSDPR